MSQNKITTYFLYAAGEILLVVVGILVAIQIDNWNENRKEKEIERSTIISLKQEFEENLDALKFEMGRLEGVINSCEFLYDRTGPDFRSGSINVDSILTNTMSYPTWSPSDYILNDIKNAGALKSISNDSLKTLLLEWDRFYSNLEDWHSFYEDRSIQYFNYIAQNAVSKNTLFYAPEVMLDKKSKFKRTNDMLMKELVFENVLADKLISSKFIFAWYQQTIPKVEAIISTCEKAASE